MTSRSRFRDWRMPGGPGTYSYRYILSHPLTTVTENTNEGFVWDTSDTVGQFWTDNPFDCKMTEFRYPRMNGELLGYLGIVTRKYDNYPITFRPTVAPSSQAYFDRPSDWSKLATDVAARTNPSAPHISLPVFIGEMRDFRDLPITVTNLGDWVSSAPAAFKGWQKLGNLPLQVYLAGKALLQALAAGNLAWRFTASPMIGDIGKLIGFVGAVEAQMKTLMALASGEGVKRRVLLGAKRYYTPYGKVLTIHSTGCYVKAQQRVCCQMSQWATARWQLICPDYLAPLSYRAMLEKARRLVLGLTRYEALSAAWELLPWSWFIDWFSNYGNWIAMMNNSIPCNLVSLCYMRTTSAKTEYKITECPSWVKLSGEQYELEVRKERIPISPLLAYLPLVTQPAIGAGQLSILGSLYSLNVGKLLEQLPKTKR